MKSDESGSVTVEFVIWVPVFVLILALTVDVSILFLTQSNLWSLARDTTRQMSTGTFTDADAEDHVSGIVSHWGGNFVVDASREFDFVEIDITVPMADVSPINILSIFSVGDIHVNLKQRTEPR